jgi:dihydropteroate synthase
VAISIDTYKAEAALAAGIHRWNLIVDPGMGFGKDVPQNLTIL